MKRHTTNWSNELRLSYKEAYAVKAELSKLAKDITTEIEALKISKAIQDCLDSLLSDRIINALKEYAYDPNIKLQIIHGWPIDSGSLPATPVSKNDSLSQIWVPVLIKIGLALLREEEPVSYIAENNGKLIRHVVSKLQAKGAVSSHGSLKTLSAHTDLAYKKIGKLEGGISTPSPTTLTLLALRAELGVPTLFAEAKEVFDSRSLDAKEALIKPAYIILPPESTSGEKELRNVPLFYQVEQQIFGRYASRVVTDDKKCMQALHELSDALKRRKFWHEIQLMPGSSVSWKNAALFHSRSAYRPMLDGADRWYLRMYSLEQGLRVPLNPEIPFLCR